MLKYNTFRSNRYLRSKFLEGKYFLASDAENLELEIFDQLRLLTKDMIGDVAIEDAWEVSRLSATELLIKPGPAWFKGLAFQLRSSSDQLVSGASLDFGIVPAGIVKTDSASGSGKILTFSTGVVPTANYRVVISAEEQVIASNGANADPFLKNANLTETTAQKIRILFKINIVLESAQTESPIPYRPDTGLYSTANLVNQINITATAGQNGEITAPGVVVLSGSEQIDGRNLEITIRNDPDNPTPGLSTKIPSGLSDQAAFANGKLIDALGAEYHLNTIYTTSATTVVLRLDKEVNQPNPTLSLGGTYSYTLVKREVYVTDDVSGNPLGKLFWPIATVAWNTSSGFVHSSSVVDLRERIITKEEFEDVVNQKFNIQATNGGVIDVDTDGYTLNWSTAFTLVNPSGPAQTIAPNSAVMLEGGTLTYEMKLAGGALGNGNLAVTVSGNAGALTSFSGGPDLTLVKIGNVIKVGSQIAQITAIDTVNKTVNVSPNITNTGAATIYRDSFAPGTVKLKENLFVLAVKQNNKIRVANDLELSAGESNAIYDVSILYPSGYSPFATPVVIPNNSITGKPQYYSASKRNLEIYINQLLKTQGVDWFSIDPQTIQFAYDLPNNTEVHYRIDSLPAGSIGGGGSGGGSGSLQDAYDVGNTIVTTGALPFTVTGSSPKVAVFIGDIEVTGVIDPKGMTFIPQATNPLPAATPGIWVNTAEQFIYEDSATTHNISQELADLTSGTVSPITGSPSILKSGNTLSTLSAPAMVSFPLAGQSFVANTSFLVRWGIDPENPSRVYKADANAPNTGKYLSFGILLSTSVVNIGQQAKVTSTGTHTLGSADTLFLTTDIGKEVFLKDNGSGGFTLTAPTTVGNAQYRIGTVQDVDKIWVDFRELIAIVPEPLYDERTLFASGLAANTDITLPVNSRNGGAAQLYTLSQGRLKVYVNQQLKFQGFGADWYAGTTANNQIKFNYALPADSEVHFRIESIASGVLVGTGGGGGGTLQDAYNADPIINVNSGNPLVINGPANEKLLVINGDITVTGVIDPTAIQFTPTATNPLGPTQAGIWINSSGALIHENGATPSTNITQVINNVTNGTNLKSYINNTGFTIPAKTPVYSSSAGHIAPADGTDPTKFRVIGLTNAAIANTATGDVVIGGVIDGISLTHNSYAYLGLTAGTLVDVGPSLGAYPSGFQVIRLGVVEGSNLLLQIQHTGTL